VSQQCGPTNPRPRQTTRAIAPASPTHFTPLAQLTYCSLHDTLPANRGTISGMSARAFPAKTHIVPRLAFQGALSTSTIRATCTLSIHERSPTFARHRPAPCAASWTVRIGWGKPWRRHSRLLWQLGGGRQCGRRWAESAVLLRCLTVRNKSAGAPSACLSSVDPPLRESYLWVANEGDDVVENKGPFYDMAG
jgi:hypothetical protein